MTAQTLTVLNRSGLHARPASMLVHEAKRFKSDLLIRRLGDDEGFNAKSIVQLLSGGFSQGAEIEILAEGEDEAAACAALAALISGGFGEI